MNFIKILTKRNNKKSIPSVLSEVGSLLEQKELDEAVVACEACSGNLLKRFAVIRKIIHYNNKTASFYDGYLCKDCDSKLEKGNIIREFDF